MSMNRASLIIMVASLVCGTWPWSLVHAAQPCTEEPDQNPEKTKLLPIVRDQASLQKFSEQRVMVVGRMNPDEWQGKKLDIAKTKTDLLKLLDSTTTTKSDRRVQIVGKYVVTHTWNPGINSNTIEFKGTYQQAGIELVDGTLVPLIPPSNKLSLRSADEVKTYSGKIVKVVGRIALEPDSPGSKNSLKSVMLTSLDGIWLK
jgi:hypothetical protein